MRSGILSFFLGFTLTLGVMGTLSNCGGGGSSGTVVTVTGQWPTVSVPCCDGSQVLGYFETKPIPMAVGQSIVLNYTVTGSNPVYVQAPQPNSNGGTDTNPPTIHIILQRANDDDTCSVTNAAAHNGGTSDYRLFGGRTLLALGANQTITVPLSTFTNCWGVAPANLADTLNNLIAIGVTFGGQSFAGHGIYLSSGSATFTVNSLKVQ